MMWTGRGGGYLLPGRSGTVRTAVDGSPRTLVHSPVRRVGGAGVALRSTRGGGRPAPGGATSGRGSGGPTGELEPGLNFCGRSRHATRHGNRLRQLVLARQNKTGGGAGCVLVGGWGYEAYHEQQYLGTSNPNVVILLVQITITSYVRKYTTHITCVDHMHTSSVDTMRA